MSTLASIATSAAKYIGKFVIKSVVMIKALSILASIAPSVAKYIGKFVIPGVVMIKTRRKKVTKTENRGSSALSSLWRRTFSG